jgi:hypothetical protein
MDVQLLKAQHVTNDRARLGSCCVDHGLVAVAVAVIDDDHE